MGPKVFNHLFYKTLNQKYTLGGRKKKKKKGIYCLLFFVLKIRPKSQQNLYNPGSPTIYSNNYANPYLGGPTFAPLTEI